MDNVYQNQCLAASPSTNKFAHIYFQFQRITKKAEMEQGPKAFKCTICDKGFCLKTYAQKGSLKKHIKLVHERNESHVVTRICRKDEKM